MLELYTDNLLFLTSCAPCAELATSMLDLARKTLQRVAGKEPKSTPADKVSDDMASLSISENNAPASTAVGVAQTATATLSSDGESTLLCQTLENALPQ